MLKKMYLKKYFLVFALQAWLMTAQAAGTIGESTESTLPERIIRILQVDSNPNAREIFGNLVTIYNAQSPSNPRIIPSFLTDGDQITLEVLCGINLVLCDIPMTNQPGDVALLRLIEEARRKGFELPPFTAVTMYHQYHNRGYEQSSLAKANHFIGVCDKFHDPQVITNILEYCRMKLGDNWLEERVGRFRIPQGMSEAVQDLLGALPLPSMPPSPGVQPSPRTIINSSVAPHLVSRVPPGDLPSVFEVRIGQETQVVVTVTPVRSFIYPATPRVSIYPPPTAHLERERASESRASLPAQKNSCWQLFLNCLRGGAITPA
jgi:hypothetical protein